MKPFLQILNQQTLQNTKLVIANTFGHDCKLLDFPLKIKVRETIGSLPECFI